MVSSLSGTSHAFTNHRDQYKPIIPPKTQTSQSPRPDPQTNGNSGEDEKRREYTYHHGLSAFLRRRCIGRHDVELVS